MVKKTEYNIVISKRAQLEIQKSWLWYEERQNGLGDRFVIEFKIRTLSIQRNPERYPVRIKTNRECPIPIFPFLIIYRFNKRKNIVRIISVFHTSLNPKKKGEKQ